MEKKLKPALRENKRYLKINESNKDKIEKAILDFIGVLGYSKAGLMVIMPNIIAVNREKLNEVKASLSFAGIKILKVSGTLAGLERQKSSP